MKQIDTIIAELMSDLNEITKVTKKVTPYFFTSISRMHYPSLIREGVEFEIDEMYKKVLPSIQALNGKIKKYKKEYSIQAVTELYHMGFDEQIGSFYEDNNYINSDFSMLIKSLENGSSFDLVEPYHSVLSKINDKFDYISERCTPFWSKVNTIRYDNQIKEISIYQSCILYITTLRKFINEFDSKYIDFANRINCISDDIRNIGNCSIGVYYNDTYFTQIESSLKDIEKSIELHKVLSLTKQDKELYEKGLIYKNDLKKWNK